MKGIIILFVILLLLEGINVKAQTVPQITGSKVTPEEAQKALDFHNKARKDVSVPALEWDADLAKYAQEWAEYLAANNNCQMKHRGYDPIKNLGENIFWGNGVVSGKGREFSALEASEAWYKEIEDYTYGPLTKQNLYGTGHYTQMVWKTTKKVGIGICRCTGYTTIIVANYYPAGNYPGQKPY